MYGKLLTFVVVLLLYATYQPSSPPAHTGDTGILTLASFVAFCFLTRLRFRIFERRILAKTNISYGEADSLVTQQTILAVLFFAFYVYGLGLKTYLATFWGVGAIPTLGAILFLFFFCVHLCVVWALAYPSYKYLQSIPWSLGHFVKTNLALGLPVLLPWLIISLTTDLIQILGLGVVADILEHPVGQMGYFLVFLVLIGMFGPVLIRIFWGCTPLPDSPERARMEEFMQKAGFSYRDILLWPLFGGSMMTAGVMGIWGRFRYVLVTDSLLRTLTPPELNAVLAHEIGHIRKKHLWLYLLFFGCYVVVSMVALDAGMYALLYINPMAFASAEPGPLTSAALAGFTILSFFIYFRYIFGYFMRNFERQADLEVFSMLPSPQPLISSLEKIAWFSGLPMDEPNWHHFSIGQRVDYLVHAAKNARWIRWHTNKVKYSLIAFVGCMVVLSGLWFGFSYGKAGESFRLNLAEKILMEETAAGKASPHAHLALGNIFQEKKEWEKAISHYLVALEQVPDNPEALNGLAWLYATCPDPEYYSAKDALLVAERAVAISSAPHILDTYAEALFINGYTQKAVEVEKAALKNAVDNKSHYRKQLKRFEEKAGPML